jgi:hypothetical protein
MKNLIRKTIALALAASLLLQSFLPQRLYALTGGPQSPEFSNFESVSTSQMVDPFTGDFTFNLPILEVPGPNGGGYPISLSYHSGSSPEEEASWVGYGWTLNPGSIARNKQGFPDDANGEEAVYYNKIGTNQTWVYGTQYYIKALNIPQVKGIWDDVAAIGLNPEAELGLNWQMTLNNKTGLSMEYVPYFNCNIAALSVHVSMEEEDIRFTKEIDPAYLINSAIDRLLFPEKEGKPNGNGDDIGKLIIKNQASRIGSWAAKASSVSPFNSPYTSKSYTLYNNSAPTVLQDYQGFSISVRAGAFVYPSCFPFGAGGSLFGTYTQQGPTDNGISTKNYYGYLNSHEAVIAESNNVLMDYTVEKQDVYNLRDNYLPIPYSAADLYGVAGESIGGSFRAYSSTIGHFGPNYQQGVINSVQAGIDFAGALTGGGTITVTAAIGVNVAVDEDAVPEEYERVANEIAELVSSGGSVTSVDKWSSISNCSFNDNQDIEEPYYFRFTGDMGGIAKHNAVSDRVVHAELSGDAQSGYSPTYSSSDLDAIVNDNIGVARASYIGYHTNTQMQTAHQRYSFRNEENWVVPADTDNPEDFDRSSLPGHHIGEFAITNKSGSRYLYALPVQASKEYELSVDVNSSDDRDGNSIIYKSLYEYFGSSDHDETIEEEDILDLSGTQKVVGTYRPDSYTTSYLLTEVTQPNYIDLTHNGTTSDDIGGWTKFNYVKLYSNYHWRMPYRGLYYNPGNLADPIDDMGNFSSGQREVYYLKSIETATHKAVFELSNRSDALESQWVCEAGEREGFYAGKSLQKLDKITLYVKNSDGSTGDVIKRVYFEYDYSSWPGMPNFTDDTAVGDPDYSSSLGNGKLTLKKVWSEYTNISNPQISPYQFEYTYPTSEDVNFPVKPKYEKVGDTWSKTEDDVYAEFENYADTDQDGYSNLEEEPSYSAHSSDRWGSYQANGDNLDENMFPWVDQTPDVNYDEVDTNDFDPSSWQLKRITLPTGGQMLIQYEQDDYQYVQDRKAMAMVKLSNNSNSSQNGSEGEEYYLDLESLGISGDEEAITKMKNYIQSIMINGANGRKPQKVYFKFLYNLTGNADPDLDVDNCNAAYIDGYVSLYEVGTTGSGSDMQLYVKLGADNNDLENDWDCPREACIEFYKTTQSNVIDNCEMSSVVNGDDYSEGDAEASNNILSDLYQLIDATTEWGNFESICLALNPDHSYLRLPLPYEKKGGGIRVKRLLTYDAGIESDAADAMVYGHEYLYVDYDGHSSGVASNEPAQGGEENALVTFLKKREESNDDQVLAAGHDKSQFQGPFGQSLLPMPAVGYSRTLIRNIHSAPTHDGINAFEYYTTKDYSFDKQYNYTDTEGNKCEYKGVSYSPLNLEMYEPSPELGILSITKKLDCWATQGYKFIINNMNGQAKKQTVYSGDWEDYNYPDSLMEVSSVRYTYFEPGEALPVLINQYGENEAVCLGRTSEIIAESKQVSSETGAESLSIELGATVTYFLGIPLPIIIPIPFKTSDQTHIYTHVTTQTDYFPPVVKSVTNYQDGAYTTASSLHFDKLTGDALISSKPGVYDQMEFTANGETTATTHEGKYFSYTIPATFYYEGLGQKAGHENITIDDNLSMLLNGSDVFIQFDGSDYCSQRDKFTVGDLISVTDESDNETSVWNVTEIDGHANKILLAASTGFDNTTFDGQAVSVKILQSGRANILTLSAGNIISYGEEFTGLSDNATTDEDQDDYRDDLADYLNAAKEANDNGTTEPRTTQYDDLNYISRTNDEGGCSACEEEDDSPVINREPELLLDNDDEETRWSLQNGNLTDGIDGISNLLSDIGIDESTLDLALDWAGSNTDRLEFLLDYASSYRDIILSGDPTDQDTEFDFLGNIAASRTNRNRVNSYLENTYNTMQLSRTYSNTSRTSYLNNLFTNH